MLFGSLFAYHALFHWKSDAAETVQKKDRTDCSSGAIK